MSKYKSKKNDSKEKTKSTNNCAVSNETGIVLAENYVELQAEAYYRAMKRLKEEEEQKDKEVVSKVKTKWWKRVIVFLNVLIFPFHIFGKKRINKKIYDDILVLPVSTLLIGGGAFFWLVGIAGIIAMITKKIVFNFNTIVFSFFILLVGSFMIISGIAFNEEQDSMKIYAYSASIIALVSCIVSIAALIWK